MGGGWWLAEYWSLVTMITVVELVGLGLGFLQLAGFVDLVRLPGLVWVVEVPTLVPSIPATDLPVADFMKGRGGVARVLTIVARSERHERITILHGTEDLLAARLMLKT